jgi:hypothetical protein
MVRRLIAGFEGVSGEQRRVKQAPRRVRRGEVVAGMILDMPAFNNMMNRFRLMNPKQYPQDTLAQFLDAIEDTFTKFVRRLYVIRTSVVWVVQMSVQAKYFRENLLEEDENKRTERTFGYHDTAFTHVERHKVNEMWTKMRAKVLESHENFVNNGSDWIYDGVEAVFFPVYQFNPLGRGRSKRKRGECAHPLPRALAMRRCVINVNNVNNECFRYAVLSCLALGSVPSKNKHRSYYYERPDIRMLADFSTCAYPVSVLNIDDFERVNPSLAVNVYTYDETEDSFLMLRTSARVRARQDLTDPNAVKYQTINLLLFNEHYMWISHITRLVNSSKRSHHHTLLCPACSHYFTTENALQKHSVYCRHMEAYAVVPTVVMPKSGNDQLRFTQCVKTQLVPVVVYADFESVLQPVDATEDDDEMNTVKIDEMIEQHRDEASSHKIAANKHIPCGFGIKLVCSLDPQRTQPTYIYRVGIEIDEEERDKDCINKFLAKLYEYEATVTSWYATPKAMLLLTSDEERAHADAKTCWMCLEAFNVAPERQDRFRLSTKVREYADNWRKVHDHCHFTGKYRGAAHSWCNLQTKSKFKLPVIIHNFRGYDSHLIMRCGNFEDVKRISCIANTLEKYMCVDIDKHIRFIDSLQFLNASLDKLVEMRRDEIAQYQRENRAASVYEAHAHAFPLLTEEFPSDGHRIMLLRKGVYPYEWMTKWTKFYSAEFPQQADFRSRLTHGDDFQTKGISDADYAHAKNVWQSLGGYDENTVGTMRTGKTQMINFGEYHDIYLRTDVLLLADVFEGFRKLCLADYQVDPAHCLSAPNLSWQCMLKYTGASIQLLTDEEMYRMFQNGLRGGMCYVSKRYVQARNPYTDGSRTMDNPTNTWIIYLDANNLYGAAMMMPLPYGEYEWMPDDVVRTLFGDMEQLKRWLEKQTIEQEKGYVLEVDLEYPEEIHDFMNDYPVAVERKTVFTSQFSEKQHALLKANGVHYVESVSKLLASLERKENYVVHYLNLQLYVRLGVRVTRVHRACSFLQKRWLAPYIELNTEKRKVAKNAFIKNLVKLYNVSVYGKCVENVLKRRSIFLVNSRRKAKAKCDNPLLKTLRIFSETLAAVEMQKTNVTINKPTAVGFTVLELSKYIMFDFHYNVMKRKYGSRLQLLFTDTDSLTYEVQTANIYADMHAMREHFDLSEYAADSPYRSMENKLVVGKMKDEFHGRVVDEYVGCAAKMYSFRVVDGEEKNAAKGVPRTALKHIYHDDYYQQVMGRPRINYANSYQISSTSHELQTVHNRKRALSSFDSKRMIMPDGIHTLAYGNKRCLEIIVAPSTTVAAAAAHQRKRKRQSDEKEGVPAKRACESDDDKAPATTTATTFQEVDARVALHDHDYL